MMTCSLRSFATLFLIVTSLTVDVETDDYNDDVIIGSRCRVRCLTLLKNQLRDGERGQGILLSSCKDDDLCSACTQPCDQLSLNTSQCRQMCTASSSAKTCSESCHFLLQVNSIRPGTCPPEMQATGTAARCVKSCRNDGDCDQRLRCCSNGCGWTCQHPTHANDGMPEISLTPEVMKSSTLDGVTLKWTVVLSNTSSPILYFVESRFVIGRQIYQGQVWSLWIQVAQTTNTSLTINKLRPGHWYQFRVSAINIYGTRGPSLPTKPYKTTIEPGRPTSPVNVTEGETLLINGQIAVTITWSSPTESDLPVSRYKIYWWKKLKAQLTSMSSSQEFRQVLPADHLKFQITDLEPNSTYFVQVQAISQFGEMRLKSDRSSVLINTIGLKHAVDQKFGSSEPLVLSRSYITPSSPTSLFVDPIYYQNGLLRANVSWDLDEDDEVEKFVVQWSPEACATDSEEGVIPIMSSTTDTNNFVVYDLRFDCRYIIRVQPISPDGFAGAFAHISISTPFCDQVLVIGDVQPDCPLNAPRIPDEPPELSHSFIITSTNITCRLSWGVPSSEGSITGYQVAWGQILTGSQFLLMDKTTAVSKLLSKDVQFFNIGGLSEASSYIFQVQATSKAGMGRVSSLRFTTPRLQILPSNPSYKELGVVDSVSRPATKKKQGTNIILANVATVQVRSVAEPSTRTPLASSNADNWFDQLLPQTTSAALTVIFQRTGLWILLSVCFSGAMMI